MIKHLMRNKVVSMCAIVALVTMFATAEQAVGAWGDAVSEIPMLSWSSCPSSSEQLQACNNRSGQGVGRINEYRCYRKSDVTWLVCAWGQSTAGAGATKVGRVPGDAVEVAPMTSWSSCPSSAEQWKACDSQSQSGYGPLNEYSCSMEGNVPTLNCAWGTAIVGEGATRVACNSVNGARAGQVGGAVACAGRWSVPGINATGEGYKASDVCSDGWSICTKDQISTCEGITGGFFATATSGPGNYRCGEGTNDLFGCGDIGVATDVIKDCGPLNRGSGNGCSVIAEQGWTCVEGDHEFDNAVHSSNVGGVMCCPP